MDDLELEVRKTVLDNAIKYEGKPSVNSVMSALLGSRADLRSRAAEVKSLAEKLVDEISKMSLEDQIAELKQIAPELLETPDTVEVEEEKVIEGTSVAQEAIRKIIDAQKELFAKLNIKKRDFSPKEVDQERLAKIEKDISSSLLEAVQRSNSREKGEATKIILDELLESIPEENEEEINEIKEIFYRIQKKLVRNLILEKEKRTDGRAFDEIRPITVEVGILPRTHGSALFTRGETQCLATVTLGTFEDVQRLDGIGDEAEKRFMLHYNFPPFSVGEVAFLRGPGRREIGHGALAEKSILPSIALRISPCLAII